MEYRVDERAKRIARKLRKIRELKGLTREKFCEPLGENSDYWGLIERGEQPISLPKLLQVCEVYQIPIESVVVLDYQIQDNGRVREDIDGLLGQCNEYQLEVIRKIYFGYCHDAIKYRIHPDHQAEFGTFCVVAMAACENDRPQAGFNNLF